MEKDKLLESSNGHLKISDLVSIGKLIELKNFPATIGGLSDRQKAVDARSQISTCCNSMCEQSGCKKQGWTGRKKWKLGLDCEDEGEVVDVFEKFFGNPNSYNHGLLIRSLDGVKSKARFKTTGN